MSNIQTHKGYISYFREIARQNKDIKHLDNSPHFARWDLEEILADLKSEVNYPALLLESPTGVGKDMISDNRIQLITAAYTVLDRVGPGEADQREEVLDNCKRIAQDILSRLRRDYELQDGTLLAFNLNGLQFMKVGPILDNCYGYRFEIVIGTRLNITYDATKWND